MMICGICAIFVAPNPEYIYEKMKYIMTFLRTLAVLAAVVSVQSAVAAALTPGSPTISMSFEIENNTGKVVGTVTAPVSGSDWQALPADTRMTVKVVRSCYSLGESEVPIVTFGNLAPGEQMQFVDNAAPAWRYGVEYTYTPYAYIDDNRNPYSYGSSLKPGLQFAFGYKAFTVTPAVDGKSVELTAVVPSTLTDGQPMPVPFTAVEFYRDWENPVLVGKVENPEPGATVTLTDTEPNENTTTIYVARAVTDFGYAETTERCFVGFDVPYAPYPVAAEAYQGGNRVYWTAPDRGANWGAIDPAETVYNVFRCWGYGENGRELIAENIKETEYVDYGTDMEEPLAVRYEVQAANNIGPGESNYSSYDYPLIIGPAYGLPFAETFDGGTDKVWTYTYTSYYARLYAADEADYGSGTVVEPHTGTGLIYVNYSEFRSPSGTTNSMTSYKIDLSAATTPVLSYWYYAIADNDVYIDVQVSTDGSEFTSISKTLIALDAAEAGWRKVILPLAEYAGKSALWVRFVTGFSDVASSAILDDIVVADYRSVGAIDAVADSEARTITLSWADPGSEYAPCTGYIGYVDGEKVGSVSSPWVFEADAYDTVYGFRVEALYDGVEVPLSAQVSASVPAPVITEFTSGDYTYEIIADAAEPTVMVKAYTGTRAIVSLPERVSHDDVSYVVTGVLEAAFRGNESVASIVLPSTYVSVGVEAFAGCTQLIGATIGEGVTEIGARAFAGCSALSQVIFLPTVPPAVADDAFAGIAEGCKGTCPEGTAEAYASVEGLSPIDFGVSGLSDLEIESAVSVEYFDLNGRRLESPAAGSCTIVRLTGRDGSVRTGKIMLK